MPEIAEFSGKRVFHPAFNFLVAVLALRICSYFMLSESIAVTQVLKVCLRLGLTLAMSIAFLVLRRNTGGRVRLNRTSPVLLYSLYLLLALCSLFWTSSLNDSLLQFLMDIEGFAFSAVFMLYLYQLRFSMGSKAPGLWQVIYPAVIVVAIGFYIGKLLNPDDFYRLTHGGEVARLGGFIINPNELGMLLVIGIAAALPHIFNQGRVSVLNFLLGAGLVYLLLLTGSRSSFSAMLLVIALYAFMQKNKVLTGAMFIGAILFVPLAGAQIFIKQGDVDEVLSMTGRIPFWTDLIQYNFPKEPILGFGYMRIDYADKFESLNAYAGAMTHNTFLQVLLGLGIVGLGLVLFQLFSFFHALKCTGHRMKRNITGLLFIPLLINSFTEFGIFGETNYGIIFYLMLVFDLSLEPEEKTVRTSAENAQERSSYRSAVIA